MKQMHLLLSACLATAALPGIASAANNQITFTGEVTSQTCDVSVNGATQGNVLLPTVTSQSLNAAGASTGLTPFTINATNCPDFGGPVAINTAFLGYGVDPVSGTLGNQWPTVAERAGNVNIQLMTDAAGSAPVPLTVAPYQQPGLVINAGEDSGSYTFAARYLAVGGPATAGMVQAIVEYELIYP